MGDRPGDGSRRTAARVAGITFLAYIALGIAAMILSGRATGVEGIVAKLSSIARHAPEMRLAVVFNLATGFAAIVLGATLWEITRKEGAWLAMLALACRVVEGVLAAVLIQKSLGLLWLAETPVASAVDAQAARALAGFLLGQTWGPIISATFFAVGSTCFSWLLLRGRMIPSGLAWLGVLASVLLVVGLPLQLGGVLRGPVTGFMWIPMAAFEIPLALWLILKGVR